ncbi:hypothetical protein HU200_067190 [Digitaria exilis]|uniref:Phytocyanin domain-containing protein n=1 Tax=Digitaria exilis TaxID=1010633 RepID=A0A835A0M4_9POAL|nr:hypothetical protein HU200_067190 [Digitaria exilis]CAB3504969.1 unnamed protein product [Digitaria exilis]
MAVAAASRRLLTLATALVFTCCLQAVAQQPAEAPGTRYTVGGPDGWRVPPPEVKERYYSDWAANITFYVDDTIEFVYKDDTAIRVGKAGYYHCNETIPGTRPRDGTTVFVLDAPGPAYFASANLDHCNMGQRLMIDVLDPAASGQPPAPSPWSSPPAMSPATSPAAGPSPVLAPHFAAAPAPTSSSAARAVGLVVVVPVASALVVVAGFV